MSETTQLGYPKQRLFSRDVEGYDALTRLALDMRSSWNHTTDQVWQRLDPELWDLTRNPWVVLQTVSREKLQQVLADHAGKVAGEEADVVVLGDLVPRGRGVPQADGQRNPGNDHKERPSRYET